MSDTDMSRGGGEILTEFGNWIRLKRKMQGMTQTECAERASMKVQQWSRMEKQVARPAYDTLVSVSRALMVSLEEVLGAADYEVHKPEPLQSRIGKKLEPIVMQAPQSSWGAIESALEQTARAMVGAIARPNW